MGHLHRARQYGRRTWCARRSSTQTTWMRYATRFSRCDCPGRSNCNGPTRAVNDASRSSTLSAASTRCRPSSPIAVNPTGRQSATAESASSSSSSSSPRWAPGHHAGGPTSRAEPPRYGTHRGPAGTGARSWPATTTYRTRSVVSPQPCRRVPTPRHPRRRRRAAGGCTRGRARWGRPHGRRCRCHWGRTFPPRRTPRTASGHCRRWTTSRRPSW